MRADRLLSLVLLLRSRGRMTASALARELEVSTRTVLRDVEALSAAGIPVYAERGRDGGFALLPGFTTDLTGLTADEAVALLTARSRDASEALGLGDAFSSAFRKIVAALPESARAGAAGAAGRVLVRPGGFLGDPEPEPALAAVRRAVVAGRRVRIRYPSRGEERWRTVDPLGLVSAAGRWYLLALHDDADRTYRVSRIREVAELDEPARRPAGVELRELWERRRADFRASAGGVSVAVRVRESRRAELGRLALGVTAERPDDDGWLRVEAVFGDLRHAEMVLWNLVPAAEALAPDGLRAALRDRALAVAAAHG